MEKKYAVALLKGDEEKIMGIFKTKAEADFYGENNKVPRDEGLQYCFCAMFLGDAPQGNSISVYNYYNAQPMAIYAPCK